MSMVSEEQVRISKIPKNSFRHRVLERKQGLPITLSVLYLLIARRIGFELEPIDCQDALWLDALQRRPTILCGCLVRREDFGTRANGKFSRTFLGRRFWISSLPVTVGETLSRGCRNLVHHFLLAKDSEKSNLFSGFVQEFERVQRPLLQMLDGNFISFESLEPFRRSSWSGCFGISDCSLA